VFLPFKHQKAKSHFKKPGILAFGKHLFKAYQKSVSKNTFQKAVLPKHYFWLIGFSKSQ